MKNRVFMRYPGGVGKALTLSYDDGVEQDIKLIEILNKYGIKATFNLNSGSYAAEDKVYPEGTIHRRMSKSKVSETYTNSGHEVAVHAYSHPWLETLPASEVAYEILEDRKALEAQFGGIIRGMAYPYGTYNDTVVDVLKNSGILYARTTAATKKFDIPSDWLRLPSTCHHNDSALMTLAEKFVNLKADAHAKLFYLWGHSYEFEANDNWNVIEDFCKYISGKEDIWYATNIEIFEYIEAYKQLIWSADMCTVKNPTATTIWFKSGHENESKIVEIKGGETLKIW